MILLAAAPIAAQSPGNATFRVYENGAPVGSLSMTLEPTDEGWRLHGRSDLKGAVPVVIANLDLYYDDQWNARFMTMEMKAPDDVILHAAVIGDLPGLECSICLVVRATESEYVRIAPAVKAEKSEHERGEVLSHCRVLSVCGVYVCVTLRTTP